MAMTDPLSNQGSLFVPGTANREEPVRARLLARREDPATSQQAARSKAIRLTDCQVQALAALVAYGPGTTRQVAEMYLALNPKVRRIDTVDSVHYELARRFPELERKVFVRIQQDPSKPCQCKPNAKRCRCRDVVRDGSRVWEVVTQ